MNAEIIALIVDICLLLIVALFVWQSAKRGFLRTLTEVVGCILAVVISFSLASFAAEKFYDNAVKPGIVESVNSTVNGTSTQAIGEAIDKAWSSVPSFITTLLVGDGYDKQTVTEKIEESVKQGSESIGEAVTDNIIKPIVTAAISFILAIIIFALLMVLVRFISKKVGLIKKIPLVGTANAVLGGVFGFFKGLIIIYALVVLISILMPMCQNKLWIFNAEMIGKSYLFKMLYELSPFVRLTV